MESWSSHLILFLVGLLSGTLNVLAGGGSFLTVPVLIFLGLPASVANATNRLGVFTQNVGAVLGFHRHRVLDWPLGLGAAAPTMLGAVLGARLALLVSDRAFTRLFGVFMLALTLWTLWNRSSASAAAARKCAGRNVWLIGAAFFAIGVYSGFAQAGVGFLVLAATTMIGLDLVRGNALKVLVILGSQLVSLAVFASGSKINWPPACSLAVGNLLGGQIGVHLAVRKGHGWIRTIVTVAVIVIALKLLIAP